MPILKSKGAPDQVMLITQVPNPQSLGHQPDQTGQASRFRPESRSVGLIDQCTETRRGPGTRDTHLLGFGRQSRSALHPACPSAWLMSISVCVAPCNVSAGVWAVLHRAHPRSCLGRKSFRVLSHPFAVSTGGREVLHRGPCRVDRAGGQYARDGDERTAGRDWAYGYGLPTRRCWSVEMH